MEKEPCVLIRYLGVAEIALEVQVKLCVRKNLSKTM